jgi:ATP-dependent DNA ligase
VTPMPRRFEDLLHGQYEQPLRVIAQCGQGLSRDLTARELERRITVEGHEVSAQLYAFDCLALEGDDLRGRPEGIFVVPFEQGEIGPDLFDAACRMKLEGSVSKHRGRKYRPKTCDWVKVKNRAHPAFSRVMDQF